VNGGTHGSKPYTGFGGGEASGTGWREAGVEALAVHSDWRYVTVVSDPTRV
jgi:aldehyde dehydrogenase (NAD+)